jgi:hypothetical protein
MSVSGAERLILITGAYLLCGLRDGGFGAFGNDSLRWHVRAYCHVDNKFKDFLLSRCLEARSSGEAVASPEDDVFWNETFLVVLSPNPALSSNQRAIVAFAFGSVRPCADLAELWLSVQFVTTNVAFCPPLRTTVAAW